LVANLISLLGIVVLLAVAWLLSNNRRRFPWRVAGWGLGLQLILAVILLRTPWGGAVFSGARSFVSRLLAFTDAGASFLWGNLYRTSEDLVTYINPEAKRATSRSPIRSRDSSFPSARCLSSTSCRPSSSFQA